MKVVKRGKKYKEVTCDFCEAVIAYEESEVQVERGNSPYIINNNESVDKLNWDCSSTSYIICPECNHKIILNATR